MGHRVPSCEDASSAYAMPVALNVRITAVRKRHHGGSAVDRAAHIGSIKFKPLVLGEIQTAADTLRDVLTYPTLDRVSDAAVCAALERMRLGHCAASLNEVARWDKELPLDEEQLIAFVRALLHARAG